MQKKLWTLFQRRYWSPIYLFKLWNMSNITSNISDGTSLYTFCTMFAIINTVIIDGILCILGPIGNITSFCVFGKLGWRNSTTVLIRALAVTDTFLLLFWLPLPFYFLCQTTDWCPGYSEFMNTYYSKYIRPLCVMAQVSSVWISVLISINRFIAVSQPLEAARLCTVNRARNELLCVLCFSVMFISPYFF